MNLKILGVVLAGGDSTRFGSDKASAMLGGKALLSHVCDRAAPQVDRLLVNRNGGVTSGVPAGCVVLPDDFPGEGPLAGILAGLAYAHTEGFPHVATFPCDTPFFPRDVVARLRAGLAASDADICVARRGSDEQQAFALWSVGCIPALADAFRGGLRSLHGVANIVTKNAVEFSATGEGPDGNAFFNINTVDDLARAQHWIERS